MKKMLVILGIFLMFGFVQVKAETNINQSAPIEQNKIESIYNYITNMQSDFEILKDLKPKDFINSYLTNGSGNISLKQVVKAVMAYTFKEITICFKVMAMIIVIAIIAALINNLQNAFSNENLSNIAYFACYALLIIIITKNFLIGVKLAKDTITEMSDFMMALTPTLIALITSVGGLAEAASMDPIVLAMTTIGARIYVTVIIPLILIGFVLQFVNNISEEHKISNLTKLVNQLCIWMQGFIITIFIGVVTIRGISSKTMDQVTAKTLKFAMDNFVPIVGKALSDAIASVAGYSLLLKNALSALGLIVIVIIVLVPIIKIFIYGCHYRTSK
jgi:stage III sporulation protein AE